MSYRQHSLAVFRNGRQINVATSYEREADKAPTETPSHMPPDKKVPEPKSPDDDDIFEAIANITSKLGKAKIGSRKAKSG